MIEDPINGLKDLKNVSFENSYEAYLITQIKICILLPKVIEEYIKKLNVDEDIDTVLELFELKVYDIKKNIYSNLGEWELLSIILMMRGALKSAVTPKDMVICC